MRLNRILLCAALLSVPVSTGHAQRVGPDGSGTADRSAIELCLKLATDNGEQRARLKDQPGEKPGAAGRLEAAATNAASDPRSCIGAVSVQCMEAPGGFSTAGMVNCLNRELEVWDERLNRLYKEALKDVSPKLAAAIRMTQRAWLAWRDASCKVPVLENEGGTIVGPTVAECLLDATAHQAIWLEARSK